MSLQEDDRINKATSPKPVVSDAAVKAAYDVFVAIARDQIDKLDFDIEELPKVICRLHKESETGKVLIFFSYLEDRMSQILKHLMVDLKSKNDEAKLFGNNSPFGTFSNKILLSYHLGWISEEQKNKLNALRGIRNAFAHQAFNSSLSDESIKSYISIIQDGSLVRLEGIKSAAAAASQDKDEIEILGRKISDESIFICSLALLAGDTFIELLSRHAATRNMISPHSLIERSELGSSVIYKLQRAAAEAVLCGLGLC